MNNQNNKLALAKKNYEVGDFKKARKLCNELLLDQSALPQTRKEAIKILDATGIDYMAIIIFASSGFLLLFLILKFIL